MNDKSFKDLILSALEFNDYQQKTKKFFINNNDIYQNLSQKEEFLVDGIFIGYEAALSRVSFHYRGYKTMNKTFENWWGNRGETWNGKLDIKQFSSEVWTAALSESQEEIERLRKVSDKGREITVSSEEVIEKLEKKNEALKRKINDLNKRLVLLGEDDDIVWFVR